MRRLTEADQPRHLADAQRRLLDQQLGGCPQPARVEILAKGRLAELRVGAVELSRRARERSRHPRERERTAIVTGNRHPREQVQAAALLEGGLAHIG
jgi:hypothetical protein